MKYEDDEPVASSSCNQNYRYVLDYNRHVDDGYNVLRFSSRQNIIPPSPTETTSNVFNLQEYRNDRRNKLLEELESVNSFIEEFQQRKASIMAELDRLNAVLPRKSVIIYYIQTLFILL